MSNNIEDIKHELRSREPIFHQKELCSTRELLKKYAAPDFLGGRSIWKSL